MFVNFKRTPGSGISGSHYCELRILELPVGDLSDAATFIILDYRGLLVFARVSGKLSSQGFSRISFSKTDPRNVHFILAPTEPLLIL